MKILYVTTVGATMTFFKDFFKDLIANGHTVELACNEKEWDYSDSIKELGLKTYHIDCSRSISSSGNIKCIKQIRQLVEANKYDIVHCHTPIAAACTRLACKGLRKKKEHPVRVFYTAHGFHFYKGAPKKNWIIYYPIEKLCAKWTDCLIAINKEDYNLAKNKFESSTCKVEYVPGVGIDVDKFANVVVDRKAKRIELEIPEDAFLLLSVGELNANKNHEIVLRALSNLIKTPEGKAKNYYYAIAGQGPLKDFLENLAKELGIQDRFKLLGYRNDCPELYKTADLLVHPSLREGLPVTLMEALAAGLSCVGSHIRGNEDILPKSHLFANQQELLSVIKNADDAYVDANTYGKHNINKIVLGAYNS